MVCGRESPYFATRDKTAPYYCAECPVTFLSYGQKLSRLNAPNANRMRSRIPKPKTFNMGRIRLSRKIFGDYFLDTRVEVWKDASCERDRGKSGFFSRLALRLLGLFFDLGENGFWEQML